MKSPPSNYGFDEFYQTPHFFLPLAGHGDPLDSYENTQGAALVTNNKKNLKASSTADCALKCETETEFVCRYFYCH